jgi:hypothetical protein
MPRGQAQNDLQMRREIIARCERTLRDVEGGVGRSWQTEKAISDLRLWLKVLTQQTDDMEKQATQRR